MFFPEHLQLALSDRSGTDKGAPLVEGVVVPEYYGKYLQQFSCIWRAMINRCVINLISESREAVSRTMMLKLIQK
jgi:hypothetical protein